MSVRNAENACSSEGGNGIAEVGLVPAGLIPESQCSKGTKEEAGHGQEATSRGHLGPKLGAWRECAETAQVKSPRPCHKRKLRGNTKTGRRGWGQTVQKGKLF